MWEHTTSQSQILKSPKAKKEKFKCPSCGAVCGSQSHLTNHVAKNHQISKSSPKEFKGKEEKFKCPSCGAVCGSQSHLTNHVAKNHQISKSSSKESKGKKEKFKCPSCGAVCKSQKNLTKHMAKQHQELETNPEEGECSSSQVSLKCHVVQKHVRGQCPYKYGSRDWFNCPSCGIYSGVLSASVATYTTMEPMRLRVNDKVATRYQQSRTTYQVGGIPPARELPKELDPEHYYGSEDDFSVVRERTYHAEQRMRERNISLDYVIKHEDQFPISPDGKVITAYRLKKSNDVLCSCQIDSKCAGHGKKLVDELKGILLNLKLEMMMYGNTTLVVKGRDTTNRKALAQALVNYFHRIVHGSGKELDELIAMVKDGETIDQTKVVRRLVSRILRTSNRRTKR